MMQSNHVEDYGFTRFLGWSLGQGLGEDLGEGVEQGLEQGLGQGLGQGLEQRLEPTGTGQARKGWYALMQSSIQTPTPSTTTTNPTKRENVENVENVGGVRVQNEGVAGGGVEAGVEAEAGVAGEERGAGVAGVAGVEGVAGEERGGVVAGGEVRERIYKDSVLMVRHNGKAESCVHCGRWSQQAGEPWWVGSCDITGAKKTNKSHCDIMCREAVEE